MYLAWSSEEEVGGDLLGVSEVEGDMVVGVDMEDTPPTAGKLHLLWLAIRHFGMYFASLMASFEFLPNKGALKEGIVISQLEMD